MRAPIGIRISSRRKLMGISQAELARRAKISPSYLNLIEANKRDVGGTLLLRLAAELAIDIDELTGESEHRLIAELDEASADPVLAGSGFGNGDARDLVARHPAAAANCTVKVDGLPLEGSYEMHLLSSDSPDASNSIEAPRAVAPQTQRVSVSEGKIVVPAHSICIISS